MNLVPPPVRALLRAFLIQASNALNNRIILDPFGSVAEVVAIAAVRGRDNGEGDNREGDDLDLFFHLGLDNFRRNYYGFGSVDNPENCFFPWDLAQGPQGGNLPPMTNNVNLNIAKSCCLMSLLSYRSDEQIRSCMTTEGPDGMRMLPNVSFFSVHTDQEGDLGVFVDHEQRWAVFCFRGTEFETGRDWLTSALLNPAVGFHSGSDDGTGHMRQTKVRDRYFKQMEYAVGRHFSLNKVVTDPEHDVFRDDDRVSAMDIALYLHNQDCKIYCTGHSLGGGMATLLGAYFISFGLNPAAIVSFGSPPVGDHDFCEWFNEAVPVSWRFVNEDEFAPMAPPIPFTERRPVNEQELRHVKGFIPCEDLGRPDADLTALTPEQMEERIFELSRDGHPSKMILDHNLAVTLRRLLEFGARQGTVILPR